VERFIELGALKKVEDSKQKLLPSGEPSEYRGFNIDGKKMDWGSSHDEDENKDLHTNNLHVASYFNQVKCIEYLLSPEAVAAWKRDLLVKRMYLFLWIFL